MTRRRRTFILTTTVATCAAVAVAIGPAFAADEVAPAHPMTPMTGRADFTG